MNKKVLYIAIGTFAGLLLGYLIFSSGQAEGNGTGIEAEPADHSHAANDLWTCSMHPQILQPEPGDCPLCGMDLIPAGAADLQGASNQIRMTENAMVLADIRTTRVGDRGDATNGFLTLSGRIVENEEANRVQASYFDGRIEQLYASYEGQQIRQGQPLASLYAPDLVAAQQELLTAAPLKESQPALYRAVRNKLRNWKLTDAQIDQIEKEGSVKETFPVYANVSGTVTELMTSEGDFVKAGQPIARLSNLSTVWAELDAYESQLDQFRIGQDILITTNAYPDLKIPARISFIDPLLQSTTRTVSIRAVLKNTNGRLKPGMFVSARIPVNKAAGNGPLTIPASAVMWTGERSLVYVKQRPDQPVFEMREVTLGSRIDDRFVVSSGLEDGEEIVVNGTFTVDAAAQLQGKKSMMNPSGGRSATRHEGHSGMMGAATSGTAEVPMELSEAFQKGFLRGIPHYLEMKDAFVASDPESVVEEAEKTLLEFQTLAKSSHGNAVDAHLTAGMELLRAISETGDLEQQRKHFVDLNKHLIALAQNMKGTGTPLYVQLCPMANENQGAQWLSTEKEIRNPYYGDAMLTCGSIVDSIQ